MARFIILLAILGYGHSSIKGRLVGINNPHAAHNLRDQTQSIVARNCGISQFNPRRFWNEVLQIVDLLVRSCSDLFLCSITADA